MSAGSWLEVAAERDQLRQDRDEWRSAYMDALSVIGEAREEIGRLRDDCALLAEALDPRFATDGAWLRPDVYAAYERAVSSVRSLVPTNPPCDPDCPARSESGYGTCTCKPLPPEAA